MPRIGSYNRVKLSPKQYREQWRRDEQLVQEALAGLPDRTPDDRRFRSIMQWQLRAHYKQLRKKAVYSGGDNVSDPAPLLARRYPFVDPEQS